MQDSHGKRKTELRGINMSEIEKKPEEKKIENPVTSKDDEKTKETIERRVVEHIIKFEDEKPAQVVPPVEKKEEKVVEKPAESVEEFRTKFVNAETARKKAEEDLNALKQSGKLTEDELTQKNNQLQAIALREFEEKKTFLVGKIKEALGDEKANEAAEKIKSGKDIDAISQWVDYFDNAIKVGKGEFKPENKSTSTPAGKLNASKPTNTGTEQTWESQEAMVNEVFDTLEEQLFLRAMNQPYDAKKLEKAEKMEQKLLKSLVEGEKNRGKITPMRIMECRNCGQILTGGETTCPNVNCGKPVFHKTTGGI